MFWQIRCVHESETRDFQSHKSLAEFDSLSGYESENPLQIIAKFEN